MHSAATLPPVERAASPARWSRSVAWLDKVFGSLTEGVAALLVLAEILLLLSGIVSRYVFNQPLVWSDELASVLFLWLAMLGSVIAFRRNEHMRMTAIVGMLTPHRRAVLDVVAVGAAFAFLAFTLHPAIEFTRDEVFITMPTLGISNAWRTAALPIGLALMLVFSVLRAGSPAKRCGVG